MWCRSVSMLSVLALFAICLSACQQGKEESGTDARQTQAKQTDIELLSAPIAKKIPYDVSVHGDTRIDNYYWMRDDTRSDKDLIAHLEAENAYTTKVMARTENLQEKLYQELVARIEKDDSSVPYKKHGYWYKASFSGDLEYPVFSRLPVSLNADEELLIDVNELAEGHEFFSFGWMSISPNSQIAAYTTDSLSRRIYTIEFKDLKTGAMLADKIEGANRSVVWANDNQTIFYVNKDPQTLLGYQVFRHKLGTPQSDDVLVYEEKDNTFYTGIGKTLDESQILIFHDHTIKSGVSLIDANKPESAARIFQPIESGHEYSVKKSGDFYYIRTNWDAKNFRIMKVAVNDVGDRNKWQEVVAHASDTYISDYLLFAGYLIISEIREAVTGIRVISLDGKRVFSLPFDEQAFAVSFEINANFETDKLRINYSSLTTPHTVYEYDLLDASRKLLKQQKVLGGFMAQDYQSERIFVSARDGAKIPVSIVYKKALFKKDGSNPLYQYGYGSYGSNVTPRFRANILPLLDRGFVYVIAHIRGSQTMGRAWYEDGKLFNKRNTFTDFIDVTKAMLKLKYADANRVFAQGGSAGGLLMGGVLNMAPDLYTGIIANVPFVDVLTTMLDESIPLTSNEWDEWGDPRDPDYYAYMKSYSPYDNVEKKAYPNMLVTTGFHDSQVQYFEPAKWVAKLREYKTDDNLLIFNVDMAAGHGGASGRFKRYHEQALEYAFVLDLAGMRE